jgi:hypothetical protein
MLANPDAQSLLAVGMKITHLSISIFVGASLAAFFAAKDAPTITPGCLVTVLLRRLVLAMAQLLFLAQPVMSSSL